MSEEHVEHLTDDFLHGVLDDQQTARVTQHVAECEPCRDALAEARKRQDALLSLQPVRASENLVWRTMNRINHTHPRVGVVRKRVAQLMMTAAAVCLAFAGYFYTQRANLDEPRYALRIQGQDTLIPGSRAAVRLHLFDQFSERNVADAPVSVHLISSSSPNQVLVTEAETDANGCVEASFAVPDWSDGEYQFVAVAETLDGDEHLKSAVKIKRSFKLMLNPDKPVYQPGQTIHLRSMALRRANLKPVSGEDAEFQITDPKGNVIFRQVMPTSDYGIASTDCELASEITHGQYKVDCRMGDTTSSLSVEVKRYTLPKFRADVKFDRPFYSPRDEISGWIQADYFFGKPVVGAKVLFTLETIDVEVNEFASVEAVTDVNGSAEFEFKMPKLLVGKDGQDEAEIRVRASVIDTAGQKETTSQTRMVANQPIRIEAVPESGIIIPGVTNRVFVRTTYPDGRPAKTTVKWSTGEMKSNSMGLAAIRVTPSTLPYQDTFEVHDDDGRSAKAHVRLTGDQGMDYLVRTDRAVYSAGDSIQISALGQSREPIFFDLIQGGQSLLTDTIELKNGEGEFEFDIPPEIYGTLQLVTYRMSSRGVRPSLAHSTMRVIHVRRSSDVLVDAVFGEAGELGKDARDRTLRRLRRNLPDQPVTVQAGSSRGGGGGGNLVEDVPVYRPGDNAGLTLRLRDKQGNPVQGAIGVWAVDEAVSRVLQDRTGVGRTFFEVDQELLKPVLTAYAWSPNLTPEDKNAWREFENAIFARAARVVDDGRYRRREERADLAPSPITLMQSNLGSKLAEYWQSRNGLSRSVFQSWFVFWALVTSTCGLIWPKRTLLVLATVFFGLIGLFFFFAMMVGCGAEDLERAADQFAFAGKKAEATAMVELSELPAPGGAADNVRVRSWFPETLMWMPELITDENGQVDIEFPIADSITNWKVSTSAVTAGGKLGGREIDMRVFQPFFVDVDLPVALTTEDEVDVPLVVYNYMNEPQSVTVSLAEGDWFEMLRSEVPLAPGGSVFGRTATLNLQPNDVRSISFRIKAKRPGQHKIEVMASSGGVADAVRRDVLVEPHGRKVEQVVNGSLDGPVEVEVVQTDGAVPDSAKLIVKLYPSGFSQIVEGLDGVFRKPHGCFEQTSSTTYPNVLALDYLKSNGLAMPAVEAKARQYIHLGYQRLLTFEVSSGGFTWFGSGPGNTSLTAYGLLEFTDMSRVIHVDRQMLARTAKWLLSQAKEDGTWPSGRLHGSGRGGQTNYEYITTAYVAWAIAQSFADQQSVLRANEQPAGTIAGVPEKTWEELLTRDVASFADPYELALTINAISAGLPKHKRLAELRQRLVDMAQPGESLRELRWQLGQGHTTLFYGRGAGGDVEATALAVLALADDAEHAGVVRRGLTWLVSQRGAHGSWPSTQATVLALKALVAGATCPDNERPKHITLFVDDQQVAEVDIPVDQADVMQQVNLSQHITGQRHRLRLVEANGSSIGYQSSFSFHVPESVEEQPRNLAVTLSYDRSELSTKETVTATATATNNTQSSVPMVMLDLPIPAGFRVDTQAFEQLKAAQKISRFEITPRQVIVYLRSLSPDNPFEVKYSLRATRPVKVNAPPAKLYEYYAPENRARSTRTLLRVKPTRA